MDKKKYLIKCYADCTSEIEEELTYEEYLLVKRISDRLQNEGVYCGGILEIQEKL